MVYGSITLNRCERHGIIMEHLLEVKNLQTSVVKQKTETNLTSDVSFYIDKGETVGIVGESGCGKSVTALSIIQLLAKNVKITNGSVLFEGEDLVKRTDKEMNAIRGNDISMIFQDTMSALNPVFTIGNQLVEAICTHQNLSKEEARKEAIQLLSNVGLPRPEKIMKEYSFMLSGGMRQRAMIAMALSCSPKLLIADEPTTALDVTIQAQIVELIKKLRKEQNMSVLLISHDMGLIAELVDRVIVMYAGEIVEESNVYELFERPMHPYTKALLDSIPKVEDEKSRVLESIPGAVPENYPEITCCRFSTRCKYAFDQCKKEHPGLEEIEEKHFVRCFAVDKEGYFDARN